MKFNSTELIRIWQDEEGTDCCIIEEMIVMVEDQMSLENDSTTQIAQILPHDEDLYTTDRNNNNTPVEDISIIQALKVNSHMNFKDYEAIVTSSPKRNFAEMSADLVVPAQEISTQTEISSEGSKEESSEDDSKIGDTSENVTDNDEDDITEFTVLTSPMCKANRIKSLSTNDIGAGILLITSAKHQENVAEIIVPAKDSSTQTDFIDDDEEPNESIADESFPVYAVAKKSAFRSQTLNSFFPSQMQLNVIKRKGQ